MLLSVVTVRLRQGGVGEHESTFLPTTSSWDE